MVGETVIHRGVELVIVWDGSLGPRPIVIPTVTPRSNDRPCGCGCGRNVSPPARYASYACAGKALQGRNVAERVKASTGSRV
jgi:hypothetical protein